MDSKQIIAELRQVLKDFDDFRANAIECALSEPERIELSRSASRIEGAMTAAADLLEADGWVSVEERAIPDDGGSYLVTDGHYVAPMVRGVIRNNTGTRNDFPWGIEPTHWRPLPAPPGGDHD